MDKDIAIEIFGDAELAETFLKLEQEMQSKLIYRGLLKSAQIIKDHTKVNLTSATKAYEKFYKVIGSKRDNKSEIVSLFTGIRSKDVGTLAHLIESGTVERFYLTKKNKVVHRTGKMPAAHFFQKSYDESIEEVEDNLYKFITASLNRYIKKTTKTK